MGDAEGWPACRKRGQETAAQEPQRRLAAEGKMPSVTLGGPRIGAAICTIPHILCWPVTKAAHLGAGYGICEPLPSSPSPIAPYSHRLQRAPGTCTEPAHGEHASNVW